MVSSQAYDPIRFVRGVAEGLKRTRGHLVAVWAIVLLAAASAVTLGIASHPGHSTGSITTVRDSPEVHNGTGAPVVTDRTDLGAIRSSPATSRPDSGPASSGWAVASTLVVFNNTSIPGDYEVAENGAQGDVIAMAFDNLSGQVFALSEGGVVSVVSDVTDEVVHSFYPTYLGTPAGIAFDYKDNELFILYYNYLAASYVEVVSASTTSFVATVTVQDGAAGIAYDSGLGEVFVSNAQSENVSVISAATNSVVATVYLPVGVPESMVYDSGQHEVFVLNDQYDLYHTNVTVISDATNTVVATIAAQYGAISLAYDSGKGEVFVGSDIYGAGGTCNVTVINDTTNSIVATIDVGIDPKGIAYVPSLGELYVTNTGSNNVSVISDATNAVTATVPLDCNPNVPVDCYPEYPVNDPGQGEVWFYGGFPGYVIAISTSTHDVAPAAWLTFASRYFAYASANQEEYLVDPVGYVAVVSDLTDHLVAEIPAGAGIYQAAYDSGKGEVWVTNNGGPGNISVINTTTNTVIHVFSIPGVGPTGIAYDPAQGEMFVGNEYCPPCSNVTVINDTTYGVVGVIATPGFVPFDLAYDSGKGEIFASNIGGNVTVINATTDTVVAMVGTGIQGGWGMAYDSASGEMFLTNVNNNNVTVISDSTNTVVANISGVPGSWGASYDPATGQVFIGSDEASAITIISGTNNTVTGSIPDGQAPSSVAYDAETGDIYTSDQDLGTFQVVAPTGGTGPTHYPVTFIETGLPTGSRWTVTFNATLGSSTSNSIGYSVLDGTYSYTVGTVAGYTSNVTGGPVVVDGAAVHVEIGFTSTGVPTYTVTFDESGLPSSTPWTVTLEGTPVGSTTSTIQFTEADGTFSFSVGAVDGYTSAPSSGALTVSGSAVTQDIVFTSTSKPPTTYPITFTESGLPSGTGWSVTLDGTVLPSSSSTLATSDANGSYPYTVAAVTGYSSSPTSGTVIVAGSGVTVLITFTASTSTPPPPAPSSGFLGLGGSDGYILLGLILLVIAVLLLFLLLAWRGKYPVVFTESGLPPGTHWSVRLKPSNESSTAESIRFRRASGTYEYEVAPVAGRTPIPATGYVVVEKEETVISVRFDRPAKGP